MGLTGGRRCGQRLRYDSAIHGRSSELHPHRGSSVHERLTRDIASLRARATKETQLNRRVELNIEVKRLEACLAADLSHL